MAMVKMFSPSGWDWESPVASLVKIASGGLTGQDRRNFVKRASGSENVFLPYLDSIKFAADEEAMHLIALGAKEAYGSNRNGDAFMEQVLRDTHNTFVKLAMYYRNHKNKDRNISYGTVKCSAYNEGMRRVELLVALNREKSAAERNGGFVADRELEKLAKGEDIAVSMACRVPYDECSYCHNKARTREDYCTADMCKAGGCKDNLTRLVKMGNDVHLLHVNNPGPAFFDISGVFRPADRIAYGGKADYLTKAASFGGFMGVDGARTAEDLGVMAPLAVILAQDEHIYGRGTHVADLVKLAHGLALAESSPAMAMPAEIKRAFSTDVQPEINLHELELDSESPTKVAAALGALADEKVILPLREFARVTKRAELSDAAGERVPGAYKRMINDGTLEARVVGNRFAPSEKLAAYKVRSAAMGLKRAHGLEKDAVDHRCKLSAIRQNSLPASKYVFGTEKRASDNPMAEELARDYAVYKLAALRRISTFDPEFVLTARLAICQNQVS